MKGKVIFIGIKQEQKNVFEKKNSKWPTKKNSFINF